MRVRTIWFLTTRRAPADNGFDMGADEFVFTGIQVFIQTVPDPVVAGVDFQLVRVVNIGNIDQNAKITVTLPSEMTPSGVLTFYVRFRRSETWVKTINAKVNASFSGSLKIKADVTTSANSSESIEASISVAKPDFAITLIAEPLPLPFRQEQNSSTRYACQQCRQPTAHGRSRGNLPRHGFSRRPACFLTRGVRAERSMD